MSDYRVVPVEPTPAMREPWRRMRGYSWYNKYKAMLAAAPAVQVEPVACVSEETYSSDGTSDIITKSLPIGTKLYAAPQPAEQQPPPDYSLTPVPDELFAAEFRAWWEQHGQFCRAGGGDYESTFAFEAWRHLYPKLMSLQMLVVEQQPAPDVAGLVEALERARNDLSEWIASYPDSSHACTSNPIKHIDSILADRRGRGNDC